MPGHQWPRPKIWPLVVSSRQSYAPNWAPCRFSTIIFNFIFFEKDLTTIFLVFAKLLVKILLFCESFHENKMLQNIAKFHNISWCLLNFFHSRKKKIAFLWKPLLHRCNFGGGRGGGQKNLSLKVLIFAYFCLNLAKIAMF